jgi:hypothetical protein
MALHTQREAVEKSGKRRNNCLSRDLHSGSTIMCTLCITRSASGTFYRQEIEGKTFTGFHSRQANVHRTSNLIALAERAKEKVWELALIETDYLLRSSLTPLQCLLSWRKTSEI